MKVLDRKPPLLLVKDIKPRTKQIFGETASYTDTRTINKGQPIGAGFFMFLTYPETLTFQVPRL